MLLQEYTGVVTIAHGGYWIVQDAEPTAWEGAMGATFTGAMGPDGLYLFSGRYSARHLSVGRGPRQPTRPPRRVGQGS